MATRVSGPTSRTAGAWISRARSDHAWTCSRSQSPRRLWSTGMVRRISRRAIRPFGAPICSPGRERPHPVPGPGARRQQAGPGQEPASDRRHPPRRPGGAHRPGRRVGARRRAASRRVLAPTTRRSPRSPRPGARRSSNGPRRWPPTRRRRSTSRSTRSAWARPGSGPFETLVLLQPTSPLIEPADVVAAVERHRARGGVAGHERHGRATRRPGTSRRTATGVLEADRARRRPSDDRLLAGAFYVVDAADARAGRAGSSSPGRTIGLEVAAGAGDRRRRGAATS